MTHIPEGMKPWHGGDGPPDDWDGGSVLCRGGKVCGQTAECHSQIDDDQWQDESNKWDIIAYTPKAPAYPEGMTPELAERMVAHFRSICEKYNRVRDGDIYLNAELREARAIMAEIEPVDPVIEAFEKAIGVELTASGLADLHTELAKRGLTITEAKP